MTRRVAELEAELEAASRLLKTYKAMLFGARSEKARIVLDGQGSLDLGDLSTVHVAPAANDDLMPKGQSLVPGATSALCPSICPGSFTSSNLTAPSASAVKAACTRSVRT
jgi:hypothetical protein